MNIYLDIDGVLITKDGGPAHGVLEFLKYITDNHQACWLTTHCRGDAETAVRYLQDKLPAEAMPFLRKIKATSWQTLKTEAIDFSQDFRWLDDYAMQAELDVLAKNKAKDRLMMIDLRGNKNMLISLINNI
jgi:hypothetical protein